MVRSGSAAPHADARASLSSLSPLTLSAVTLQPPVRTFACIGLLPVAGTHMHTRRGRLGDVTTVVRTGWWKPTPGGPHETVCSANGCAAACHMMR